MGKVATEKTLQKGVDLLSVLARSTVYPVKDYKEVQQIVREGLAADVFNIGDQIVETWNFNGTEYTLPFDIVHFGIVTNKNGDRVPGMYLQSHWVLAPVQFDGNEAFWYCENALNAGTYNVTMGNSWGNNVVANKVYQFTLTQAVPQGGQLVFTTATSTTSGLPDQAPANWRVRSYASAADTTHIEMVEVTEGSSGTSLGTLSISTKYADSGVNNMQRASYGYNRWSHSGMRQWLNSSATKGNWWTAQNVFDRPPDQLTSIDGFMAGLDEDFLEVVQPIQITTALNTVSDSSIGTTETTIDKFFCPSLQEEYIVPQLADVEGENWDYWIQRLDLDSPQNTYQNAENTNANVNHIRYAYENHTSPQNVRLRSANRGNAILTWFVTSTGYVSNTYATTAHRPAPACVIC